MQGNIGGFQHLYPGEEAVAIGSLHAAERGDYVVSTYREHVHAMVGGVSPRAVMAELFGRATGCCGRYAIVGETLPFAAAVGYWLRLREAFQFVLCYFGDDAGNQGTFHETLNMAALWKRPVLFICENNHYQIATEIHRHSAVAEIHRRGSAYGIDGQRVDGRDVLAVYEATRAAEQHVRACNGLCLLECETDRYSGHSMADSGAYRSALEMAELQARDPLTSFRVRAVKEGWLSEADCQEVEQAVRAAVEDAVRFAAESPQPTELSRNAVYENAGSVRWTTMTRQRNENLGGIGTARPAPELQAWEAVNVALDRAMERDDAVFILGEDVGLFGGSYRVTQGLYVKYGNRRVRDTPISENSFVGMGVGAALSGGRPVIEIMTVNFALLALDAIINMAAKLRYMSGGQLRVPLVVHMPGGVAKQLAAQHSQRLEHTLMNVHGLRIVTPGKLQDSYWQLSQAITVAEPIVVLEHELLYFSKGPFDAAAIRRRGSDVTLIAWHRMVAVTMEAAVELAENDIEAEVIDLRSPRPMDLPLRWCGRRDRGERGRIRVLRA